MSCKTYLSACLCILKTFADYIVWSRPMYLDKALQFRAVCLVLRKYFVNYSKKMFLFFIRSASINAWDSESRWSGLQLSSSGPLSSSSSLSSSGLLSATSSTSCSNRWVTYFLKAKKLLLTKTMKTCVTVHTIYIINVRGLSVN